jgi:hypothetical protein
MTSGVGVESREEWFTPVGQSPATDGAGTGDRVSGHIIPSDSEGRIHSKDRANWCGDPDPAIW